MVQTYNTRYHRTIETSPQDVERNPLKQKEVQEKNIAYYNSIKTVKPTFDKHQLVRISKFRNDFHRSYQQHFTTEIFQIWEVHRHMPLPMYTLASLDGSEILDGSFTKSELQACKLTKTIHIDQVLQDEPDRMLVTFKTMPAGFSAWIMKNQVYSI